MSKYISPLGSDFKEIFSLAFNKQIQQVNWTFERT